MEKTASALRQLLCHNSDDDARGEAPDANLSACKRDGHIAIPTALTKQLWSIWQLIVNLQTIVVGVAKVDALLTHVINGTRDLNAALLQGKIGVLERFMAVDLKGNMVYPNAIGREFLGSSGRFGGHQIQGMAILSEAHKDAAMLRI